MQNRQGIFYFLVFTLVGLVSCDKKFISEDYTAYFGGEVIHPQSNYILFMKDNELIDTIFLDKNNRFFHKFDSLAPGLYTFKHQPEYQYVYFDTNDSLMVTINTRDFDNSIVFCGRGDQKNNYLMEMYLETHKDKGMLYDIFAENPKTFQRYIDSVQVIRKALYDKHKKLVDWNEEFDELAQASLLYPYYFKKEVFPYAHKFITGENIKNQLNPSYYNHRKQVNLNNEKLSSYSPFVNYVTALLNNISFTNSKSELDEMSLEYNLKKLSITDSLIKNRKVKNMVLNGLAMRYLLEDQNMSNNKQFISHYLKLSTDKKMQNEIKSIASNIQKLGVGNHLPKENLVDVSNKNVDLDNLIKEKTIVFFWTSNFKSHYESVHRKIAGLRSEFPTIQFVSVNIDDSFDKWKETLKNIQTKDFIHLHATNFEALKKDWVINKIHRTIILNKDGSIKDGFVNIFDVNFKKHLK